MTFDTQHRLLFGFALALLVALLLTGCEADTKGAPTLQEPYSWIAYAELGEAVPDPPIVQDLKIQQSIAAAVAARPIAELIERESPCERAAAKQCEREEK
jgi:hypothetical protein